MKKYCMREISEAVGGIHVSGDGRSLVSRVCHDSRKVIAGDLFFPIKGENYDGHDFIPAAVARGCRSIIVDKHYGGMDSLISAKIEAIAVEDTIIALGNLARYYLKEIGATIVAVTGSTGKTSTKDLLYHVCKNKYITACTLGNYNNNIGLPLTILNFPQDTQVGILEMGMDGLGQIEYLTKVANPHIALVTNIGTSHIDRLGSREKIFQAKMEITKTLGSDDVLIGEKDDIFLTKESLEELGGTYRVLVTGEDPDCDVVIKDFCTKKAGGISFTLEGRGEKQSFVIPVPGRHNCLNAALAVTGGLELGISMKEAAEGLAMACLTEGRLSVIEKNGIKVIDDTYNAAPDSVKAGIDILVTTPGRRKVAILGDMLELGEISEELHRKVGEYAKDKGVDELVAIGEKARFMSEGAGEKGYCRENKEEYLKAPPIKLAAGDVVLVKGSRGMAMEEIVKDLLK